MSWGAPVEFSLSPGVAPLSLLSVSEMWPAPFLMGSSSASPFSSGAVGFSSGCGPEAEAGEGAEAKADGRGGGPLLSGAESKGCSPTACSTGRGSSCEEATDSELIYLLSVNICSAGTPLTKTGKSYQLSAHCFVALSDLKVNK